MKRSGIVAPASAMGFIDCIFLTSYKRLPVTYGSIGCPTLQVRLFLSINHLGTMGKFLSLNKLVACALIFVMIGASLVFRDREIILPEIAALAVGCLVYQNPMWLARPLLIFILPSITAVGGFFINKLGIGVAGKLFTAIVFMFIVLIFFKNTLAPALATGLLPIITNATSVSFVFSILAFTLILSITIFFRKRAAGIWAVTGRQRPKDNLLYLVLISCWILICSWNGWMFMAAIPPVIVVGYESVHKELYTFTMFYKQVACLVLAAFIGTQSLCLFNNILLAAMLDILSVAIVLRLLRFRMAPAYAMSILPMVLSGSSHVFFYRQVFAMSVLILGTVYIYKNARDWYRKWVGAAHKKGQHHSKHNIEKVGNKYFKKFNQRWFAQ